MIGARVGWAGAVLLVALGCSSDGSDGGSASGGTAGGGATGGGGSGGTGGGGGSGGTGGGGARGGTAGATGGSAGAAGSGNAGGDAGANMRRVFVSSQTYSGNFGGLAVMDATCQSLADQAALGGTWLAWASDSGQSAATRLTPSSVPYVLVGGEQIAADWADLTDGSLDVPINRDEQGSTLPASETDRVWTGTNGSGAQIGGNCNDWAGLSGAVYGVTTATDEKWTYETGNGCDNLNRIYCFEN